MNRTARAVPVIAVSLSTVCIGAAVAAPTHHHRAHAKPSNAFFITGQGRVLGGESTPSNLAIDETGTDHFIAAPVSPGRNFRYYVKKHAAEKFSHTSINYSPGNRAHASSMLLTGSTGNTIAAVFAQCSGILTTKAPIRARKLPKPTLAVPGRGCDPDDGTVVRLDGAVELQHGRLALLVTDDDENHPSPDLVPGLQVWTGKPGSGFSLAANQPTATSADINSGAAQFAFFLRDRLTHKLEIVVSANTPDAETLSLTTAMPGEPWTDPAVIATLARSESGNREYLLADAAASSDEVSIAVQPRVADPDRPNRSVPAQYLLVQSDSGAAATTTPIPHTTGADADLRLMASTQGSALHIAFDQVAGNGSGIFVEYLAGTTWSNRTRLTAGKNQYVQDLALNLKDHPVVTYYALR